MNIIKVLIVDDSVTIRAIFAEILKKDRGFELVGAAANAEEALELIERTLPHVIALDLNMPGMDGIGFLDAMTELPHHPAVVVVSSLAHHGSPICTETFEHGAIACFDKAGMIGNGPKLLALLKAAANGKISCSASRNENVTLPECRYSTDRNIWCGRHLRRYSAAMIEGSSIKVAALYRFASFAQPELLQPQIAGWCAKHGLKGTILLAHEGINGTVAGTAAGIDAVVALLRTLPGCANLDVKYSHALLMPFYRMKVRVKKEIVTMAVDGIDPTREVGTYVQPEDWNALIADPDTILIDTRNDYEVAIGTFEGAVDPKTKSFTEFPEWFRQHRDELAEGKTKFAMFCTGGIRCEKSTAFLKAEGIDDVYHLEGGILRYLETVPEAESKWQGECFVFDERVSVRHGLELGEMELCHACRRPISQEDKASAHFIEGVACPACYAERSADDRARFAERQKQIALAKKRGKQHIGVNHRVDD